MKKNATQNINVKNIFINVSKMLERSRTQVLGLFSEEFAALPVQKNEDTKVVPLSAEAQQKVRENVELLAEFLDATPMQVLILVAMFSFQLSRDSSVEKNDIARFIGINQVDFILLDSDFKALFENGYTMKNRLHNYEYKVSFELSNSIMNNVPFKRKKSKKMDRYDFCNVVSNFIRERSEECYDTHELFHQVVCLEKANAKLPFVKEVKKLLKDKQVRTLFYEICNDFMNQYERATTIESTLHDIYDIRNLRMMVSYDLMSNEHPLQKLELINVIPAQYMTDASLELTDKGKKLLLEDDYKFFTAKGGSDRRLVAAKELPDRELFFDGQLYDEIDFLKKSLMNDQFVALQKRLESKSMSKGVSALFYGMPGTGKTACAEMLAKVTGRAVYHVDIASSKVCWFGESERLVKRIFDDYRSMCAQEELKPILLFNEADALLSKRKDVNVGNCAQTENAIQNILLEEIEKLDGILIATTNLSDNLDEAFNRRFLFKIRFGNPNVDAKKAIWKSKLNWLSDDDCQQLASAYNLSGGEIDNIARKAEMEEILNGEPASIATLNAWCKGEKISKNKSGAIGFKN